MMPLINCPGEWIFPLSSLVLVPLGGSVGAFRRERLHDLQVEWSVWRMPGRIRRDKP